MTWRSLPSPPAEREPRRVADSLGQIAAGIGAPRPDLLTAVFTRWEELVGPDVAAHATPIRVRDGVLTVIVDHPAWATSLRLFTADLLRRIATHGDEVTEVVVQVDLPARDRLPPASRPAGAGGEGRRTRRDGASRRVDNQPPPQRGR